MPAKGQPTFHKGTIQNFGEAAGQQARREQYKILGKHLANKPEGNNTKFWGRRMLTEGQPISQK